MRIAPAAAIEGVVFMEQYEVLKIEIVEFDGEDVITNSLPEIDT